jgi:hypothetical protein
MPLPTGVCNARQSPLSDMSRSSAAQNGGIAFSRTAAFSTFNVNCRDPEWQLN